MKNQLVKVSMLLLFALNFSTETNAQCPSGYSQTQLNWDNLSFINIPAYTSTYVSAATVGTQRFSFGTNKVTITHNYTGTNVQGEDAGHTGETGSYGTGDDLHFLGNGAITFTFGAAVQNVKFSLYDIDVSQKVQITAVNSGVSIPLTAASVSGTILTVGGTGTNTISATTSANAAASSSSDGTINVDISGPVTAFTITVSNTGTITTGPAGGREDGDFWISDITACSSGSFPTNYQKTGSNKPYIGQPDYLITTPDNNSAYMVDPVTGKAWHLFTESASKFINSFAYDPYNKILYYVLDATTTPNTNKMIKKYDFNTETSSVVVSDISTLGIPTFDQGVESAAASYYDGALYLGIEGGSTSNRESIVWRINIDASGTLQTAYQVMGVPVGSHDWGDFMMKDGMLYDFNTSTSSTGQIKHFNLVTGSMTNYTVTAAGQVGMTWAGDLYALRNTVTKYNLDGTLGTPVTISVVRGPAWSGNAGDGAEPFKPKMDFGDAPASYDPVTGDPAVHEMDTALHLGASVDREWSTKGQTAAANSDLYDDGLSYVPVLNPSVYNYTFTMPVYNNSGSAATVCAWLDYNGNGIFDAGEGQSATVSSMASAQSVTLTWLGISSPLPNTSYTYLRIRIANTSTGMSTANPTGYFSFGEVEDYRVLVSSSPLEVNELNLTANKSGDKVQVRWAASLADAFSYNLQKSNDGVNWQTIQVQKASAAGSYEYTDSKPGNKNYYRVQVQYANGPGKLSQVKAVEFENRYVFAISPNPATSVANVSIWSGTDGQAQLRLVNAQGIEVKRLGLSLHKGNNTVALPLDGLVRGNYVLNISYDETRLSKQLIIE